MSINRENPDVVVIGSGAGGAPVAWTLAAAGASVVVLERGPRYGLTDFVHDEVEIARRSFFVPSAATDPHVIVADGGKPQTNNEGWVASCVGGGTVHMSGFFYRFHPEDFGLRDFLGPIAGASHANWPITYDELAPYYAKAEREVGVSGPAGAGSHAPTRDGPYPLPPLDVHPIAKVIDAAASQVGATAFPTPRAILSQEYRGRKKCVYCHLCGGFGCEVGAKGSTLMTLLPAATSTGNCLVIEGARASSVTSDDAGHATGVIYRDAAGVEQRLRARVVVVACSTIESARLLLLSESQRFPHGLGNGEGQVGSNLMFSTLSKAHASFRFGSDAKRTEMLLDYAPFAGRSVLDYYLPPSGAPVKKAGALNFLFPSGGPIYQSESVALRGAHVLWGAALEKRLKAYWHEQKQLDCETFGEYLPTDGTRVVLDPEVRDSLGVPVARIEIDRHAHDHEVSSYLADRAAEILTRAGADKVWKSNLGGRTMHLPMGACRMGNDPRHSVVDRNCRSHEVPNLYVSDGSTFASSGGVPPTLTILANALRVGDGIVAAMKRREL